MLPLMRELPLVRSPPSSSTWSVPLSVVPVLLTKGWFLVISQISSELSKSRFHLFHQQSALQVPLPFLMLTAPKWVLFQLYSIPSQ